MSYDTDIFRKYFTHANKETIKIEEDLRKWTPDVC